MPDLPRYLTAAEAAEYLRISTRHLRRETASGNIPVSRLGRKLLYDRAELDDYVRRSRVQPGELDDIPEDDPE